MVKEKHMITLKSYFSRLKFMVQGLQVPALWILKKFDCNMSEFRQTFIVQVINV